MGDFYGTHGIESKLALIKEFKKEVELHVVSPYVWEQFDQKWGSFQLEDFLEAEGLPVREISLGAREDWDALSGNSDVHDQEGRHWKQRKTSSLSFGYTQTFWVTPGYHKHFIFSFQTSLATCCAWVCCWEVWQ